YGWIERVCGLLGSQSSTACTKGRSANGSRVPDLVRFVCRRRTPMRALSNKFKVTVVSIASLAAVAAGAPEAKAVGGLFCSSTPIDQTAEHILFTINADTTVTAIVQVSYSGDKDAFAWIVPVPGVPKLDTNFPQRAFQALDAATAPQYRKNTCYG